MLTRLENILTFQRYEKWKVGEKLGSKAHPCYIRIRVITNRVISRFKCISSGSCYPYRSSFRKGILVLLHFISRYLITESERSKTVTFSKVLQIGLPSSNFWTASPTIRFVPSFKSADILSTVGLTCAAGLLTGLGLEAWFNQPKYRD